MPGAKVVVEFGHPERRDGLWQYWGKAGQRPGVLCDTVPKVTCYGISHHFGAKVWNMHFRAIFVDCFFLSATAACISSVLSNYVRPQILYLTLQHRLDDVHEHEGSLEVHADPEESE